MRWVWSSRKATTKSATISQLIPEKVTAAPPQKAVWRIESVGQNLATACQDGQNVQAREKVAYGSSMSGMVMSVDNLCSEHSLEHRHIAVLEVESGNGSNQDTGGQNAAEGSHQRPGDTGNADAHEGGGVDGDGAGRRLGDGGQVEHLLFIDPPQESQPYRVTT